MHLSIYTRLGGFVKKVMGINDFSLFKKNVHKKIGRLIYHKKYSAHDIVLVMMNMGVQRGSVVCIHSSMKEFYNYKGTAKDLINEILCLIGPEGTLIMPAFPSNSQRYQEGYIFDKNDDPTGAGYLAEEFRKYPGVIRSINVQHSVCAIGKYADFLVKDHHLSHDCWDDKSPWQKMIGLNAIVIDLGMPKNYIGTFDHCVESILQYDYPYWAQFFTKKQQFKYYDDNNEVQFYTNYMSEIDRRTREKRVTKYFGPNEMAQYKLSNLLIKAYYSKPCLNKMLELGRKGIGIYYIPNPAKFQFN